RYEGGGAATSTRPPGAGSGALAAGRSGAPPGRRSALGGGPVGEGLAEHPYWLEGVGDERAAANHDVGATAHAGQERPRLALHLHAARLEIHQHAEDLMILDGHAGRAHP